MGTKITVTIALESKEGYVKIANSEKVYLSVSLIKKFISIVDLKKGEFPTPLAKKTAKQNAELILKAIKNVPASDKYYSHIEKIDKYLSDFLNNSRDRIEIDQYALNGFLGACGLRSMHHAPRSMRTKKKSRTVTRRYLA